MNVIEILKFAGDVGVRFRHKDAESIIDYFFKMVDDNRCVLITENLLPIAVITFSVCNEYDEFYRNSSWDYQQHNPFGKKVYVEFLACKKWTKDIRKKFEAQLVEKYPYIQEGSGLRHKDAERTVKVKRRAYEKH